MYQKFLICLVFIFTTHGLFAQNKSETANLFNLGAPVSSSEENLENFLENFPLYVENAQTVALVEYNYAGLIENREQARNYAKANFNGPLFAVSKEIIEEDQRLIFLFLEDKSADRDALLKDVDNYIDGYLKDEYEVYAINYVYEMKTYNYYVFINPETNQVITEKNMFGFEVLTEHLAVLANIREGALRATSAIMAGEIEKAVTWMVNMANDNKHGYDQTYRWGEKGDYDCSSAIITAWQQAGVPVKTNGATYTGNMFSVFTKTGFKNVTSSVTLSSGSGTNRGDVLLNTTHHTAMVVNKNATGSNGIVHASINEKGTATGGTPGDQTGKEFCTRTYYNYPWNYVLRYTETCTTKTITTGSSSLAFGNVTNGSKSGAKTFSVSSTCLTGNITVSKGGTNPGQFTVSPTSLSGSGTVTVTYAPTATGSHSATITLSSSGATSKTVSLTGTGLAKVLTLNLSSSSTTNTSVSNTQAAGKTVYLWINDGTGTAVTRQNCTLTSGNPEVATISEYGTIYAVNNGTTVIKAVRKSDNVTGTLTLTVTGTTNYTLNLSSSSTENKSVSNTQVAGSTVYLWIKDASGGNVSRQDCTLTSSSTAVADISIYGTITAKAEGTTTITATKGSVKGTLVLTVTPNTSPLRLVIGNEAGAPYGTILNAAAIPYGKDVYLGIDGNSGGTPTWLSRAESTLTSSNPGVATIATTGTITPVGNGTTTIKAVNSGRAGSIDLTVINAPANEPVTDVTLNQATLSLNKGGTSTLTATVSPSNATNKNVKWSSSATSVATVNASGLVTAVAAGTATITVTTDDGGKTASCAVTVTDIEQPPVTVTGVSLSSNTLSLDEGATSTLTATVSPSNATNKNVTWSSNNTNVATVSGGVITAKAEGTATITVTTSDGGKTATCTVIVTSTIVVNDLLRLTIVAKKETNDQLVTDPPLDRIPPNMAAATTGAGCLFINDSQTNEPVTRLRSGGTVYEIYPAGIAEISDFGGITTTTTGNLTIKVTNAGRSGKIVIPVGDLTGKLNPAANVVTVFPTETGIAATFAGVATIELYTVDGVLIDKAKAFQSYSRHLANGVYIIRINGQAVKFVK